MGEGSEVCVGEPGEDESSFAVVALVEVAVELSIGSVG